MRPEAAKIPVHILTGFLGAGKTHLLRRLLAHGAPAETGLVVNEFASGGIDQIVLGEGKPAVQEIFGCLCCRDSGDMIGSLDMLRAAPGGSELKRVVVETSGLSSPGLVMDELLSDLRFTRHYSLGNVTTVVDLSLPQAQFLTRLESADQIGVADVIVLTNLDRVYTPELGRTLVQFEEWARRTNPDAKILRNDMPTFELHNIVFSRSDLRTRLPVASPDGAPVRGAHTVAGKDLVSASFVLEGGVPQSGLRDFASALTCFFPDMMRFKMLNRCDADRTVLVNITAGRLQGLSDLPGLKVSESHVYVIGPADAVAAVETFVRGQV